MWEIVVCVVVGGVVCEVIKVLVSGFKIKGYMIKMGVMEIDCEGFDWDVID